MDQLKKFFRNFILCGDIDYYCLLCEQSFKEKCDLDKHIRWEAHRKLIKNISVLPKYKNDSIYKIKNYFYCMHCNFATASKDAIDIHAKDEDHKANKANPKRLPEPKPATGFKWLSIGVQTPYTEEPLSADEWHGIDDKRCHLCDTIMKDVDDHITSPGHMLNLISSEIKSQDMHFYRQSNNDRAYCFQCKIIVSPSELLEHWAKEHIDKPGSLAKYFDTDKDNCKAICRSCKKTMAYKFTVMHLHKKSHKGLHEPGTKFPAKYNGPLIYADHGKLRHELKEYGRSRHIKLNEGGSKGYCSLCNLYITAHINNFKQHVDGAHHVAHLNYLVNKAREPEKVNLEKRPLLLYLYSIKFFEFGFYYKYSGIVFLKTNLKMDILSFLLLSPIPHKKKYKCYVCGVTFPMNNSEHYNSDANHKRNLLKTEVILSLEDELIREIRPGKYHCGFCNKVYPGWVIVKLHLKSWKHLCAKHDASRLIDNPKVAPNITENRDDFIYFLHSINFHLMS